MNWTQEQKFVFQQSGRDALLAWLRHRLLPDGLYPRNGVVTIYYDTPSLEFYQQKVDGHYLKAKLRLRWYESAADGGDAGSAAAVQPGATPCFLELKRRCGALRSKERIELFLDAATLENDPLHDRTIRSLPSRLPELGLPAPGLLVPVLEVRYDRYRFVDPESGTRVAVDTDIRCTRADSQWLPANAPVGLATGVLELKGDPYRTPHALESLGSRLTPGSFSKYGHCCDLLMQPIAVRN